MAHLLLPESQNVECKESWRDEYLKWVCGFANAYGGYIYIGVEDKSLDIIGVDNIKRLLEDIPNKIVTHLGIVADVNLMQADRSEYIEIFVKPSNIPISYKGVYHYRSGSTKQELKGTALQDFLLKKLGRTWDDVTIEDAGIDDIDRNSIDYFLHKGIEAQRIPESLLSAATDEILLSLHLMDNQGKLKNSAILLFGKDPLHYFPNVEFKIGRFGQDESDLILQDVISGNIIQMADKVMDILKAKYLVSPVRFDGMQRFETLEIPIEALREILYNAIAHKNYMGSSIQMHIYDDRIEIWNDGNLPDGYTEKTLYSSHPSLPRNPNIANVLFKAGFIDTWGRGFKKIYNGFNKSGLEIPTVCNHFSGVQITIKRSVFQNLRSNVGSNVGSKILNKSKERLNSIKEIIIQNPNITAKQISELLFVSSRTIERDLSKMQEEGSLLREGDKKGGRWIIIERH